ncbi:MAG: hypothetical protein H7210_07910, partial [Pyrinomonadaceae bacterium]|nr:hypothetical protein [Phycisphaerales bacterium]
MTWGPVGAPDSIRDAAGNAAYGTLRVRGSITASGGGPVNVCASAIARFTDQIVAVGTPGSGTVQYVFEVSGTTNSATTMEFSLSHSSGPVVMHTLGPSFAGAQTITSPEYPITFGQMFDLAATLSTSMAVATGGHAVPDGTVVRAADAMSGTRGARLVDMVFRQHESVLPPGSLWIRGTSGTAYSTRPVATQQWYVRADAAPGGDGLSWESALTRLTDALELARLPGVATDIWVARSPAEQPYLANSMFAVPLSGRAVSFTLSNGVRIFGGFNGTETSIDHRDIQANPTILSGDLSNDDDENLLTDNAYHVLQASRVTATLDGLTISGGYADGTESGNFVGHGGGIRMFESGLTLRNCTITHNTALTAGGGLSWNAWGSLLIEDCTFRGNRMLQGNGGGISISTGALTMRRTTMADNVAGSHGSGGAISSGGGVVTIESCDFVNNRALGPSSGGAGGAIVLVNNGSFTHCRFEGNQALTGGALRSLLARGTFLTFDRCSFHHNSAISGDGGAVSGAYHNAGTSGGGFFFTNGCTFTRNSATTSGGAVATTLWGGLTASYSDSLFVGNTAQSGGGVWGATSIEACRFIHNSAALHGGGVSAQYGSAFSAINCEFEGNYAGQWGGGIFSQPYGEVNVITHCTFLNNAAASGGGMHITNQDGGGGGARFRNSIFWGNWVGQIGSSYNPPIIDITHCDVEGNIDPHNINLPPLITARPSAGDDEVWGTADDVLPPLELTTGSPCIDVGLNSAVPPFIHTDLAGALRSFDDPATPPNGGTPVVDMGAYEFGAPLCLSISQQPMDRRVCHEASATFSVSAAGVGAVTYQWRKDGGNVVDSPNHVSGSNTPTLLILNA